MDSKQTNLDIEIINSFNRIQIKNNTLVLCDIDDTVLRYKLDLNHFYKDTHKYLMEIDDYIDEVDTMKLARDRFNVYKNNTTPQHTDNKSFDIMLSKISKTNSKLVFITARSIKFKDVTFSELEKLGIDYKMFDIHFTFDYKMPKANYIDKFINLSRYNLVYFIDDNELTVKNVKTKFPQIECFIFKYNEII
jgi:hypothetical protein